MSGHLEKLHEIIRSKPSIEMGDDYYETEPINIYPLGDISIRYISVIETSRGLDPGVYVRSNINPNKFFPWIREALTNTLISTFQSKSAVIEMSGEKWVDPSKMIGLQILGVEKETNTLFFEISQGQIKRAAG